MVFYLHSFIIVFQCLECVKESVDSAAGGDNNMIMQAKLKLEENLFKLLSYKAEAVSQYIFSN